MMTERRSKLSLSNLLPSHKRIPLPVHNLQKTLFSKSTKIIRNRSSGENKKLLTINQIGKLRNTWHPTFSTFSQPPPPPPPPLPLSHAQSGNLYRFRYKSDDHKVQKKEYSSLCNPISQQIYKQIKYDFLRKGSNINKKVVTNLMRLKLATVKKSTENRNNFKINNEQIVQMIKIFKGYGPVGMGIRNQRASPQKHHNDGRSAVMQQIDASIDAWESSFPK